MVKLPFYKSEEVLLKTSFIENIHNKDFQPLWKKGLTGKGISVLNLDTGAATHIGIDVDLKIDFTGDDQPDDLNSHGAHTQGAKGGNHNQASPIKGVSPDVYLISGKVLRDNGTGSLSDIKKAFRWALDQVPDIINMSLDIDSVDQETLNLLRKMHELGIVLCNAAGNSAGDGYGALASSPYTIAFGSIDKDDVLSSFSSYDEDNDHTDFVYFGEGQISFGSGQTVVSMSGTSMVSPLGAGLAACMKQYCKELGVTFNFYDILLQSAIFLSSEPGYGNGKMNPEGAMKYVESLSVAIDEEICDLPEIDHNCEKFDCGGIILSEDATLSERLDYRIQTLNNEKDKIVASNANMYLAIITLMIELLKLVRSIMVKNDRLKTSIFAKAKFGMKALNVIFKKLL